MVGWKSLGDWLLAILPVVAALVTLWLTNRHTRKLAEIAAAEARTRLQVEISEHRYEDRRDAVIEFDAAAQRDTDRVVEYWQRQGVYPGEVSDDEYTFPELNSALAKVSILATPEVAVAAAELKRAILAVYNGESSGWSRHVEALSTFRAASQAMLARDPTSPKGDHRGLSTTAEVAQHASPDERHPD